MKVYVFTHESDCPAVWALAQERIKYEVIDNSATGFAYGRNFADLWEKGEPFIHLEHDIVPWPGAITQLQECPEPWCVHESVIYAGRVFMGFGIGKYRPKGPAPERWRNTDWHCLDGQIVSDLRERFTDVCTHHPPVAHARKEPS